MRFEISGNVVEIIGKEVEISGGGDRPVRIVVFN